MTLEQLQVRTRKDLAQLARQRKISGWHSMRKNDLILAIFAVEATGSNRRPRYIVSQNRKTTSVEKTSPQNSATATASKVVQAEERRKRSTKKVSVKRNRLHPTYSDGQSLKEDCVTIELRDSDWLYACWDISAREVKRVESSLKHEIHTATPTIRLSTVSNNELQASSRRTCVADHEISGGKSSWYIPLPEGDNTYQVSLGYKTSKGEFRSVMHSNLVTTESSQRMKDGQPAVSNGSTEGRKNGLYSTSQDNSSRFSSGDAGSPFVVLGGEKFFIDEKLNGHSNDELQFEMDAQLVVQGVVDPAATLTLDGEAIDVDRDGRFSARYALPNGRQMISAVMVTPDQTEKRTIVMGIDRSMREMEPQKLGKKLV